MKGFLRFLMFVIIAGVIIYSVYFLIQKNNYYKSNEENNSGDYSEELSGDVNSGDNDEPVFSGDSGDIKTDLVGDLSDKENISTETSTYTKEEINDLVDKIDENIVISTFGDNFTADMLGPDADSLGEFSETNEFPVTIYVRDGKVEVIPASDFLHNQYFYYDDEGSLILYESISNTVEGVSKYYFSDGKLLEVENIYEEGITPEAESEENILTKSNAIYEKYASK